MQLKRFFTFFKKHSRANLGGSVLDRFKSPQRDLKWSKIPDFGTFKDL